LSYTLLNNAGDGIFLAVHACGMVRKKSIGIYTAVSVRRPLSTLRSFTSRLLAFVSIFGSLGWAQQPAPDWQTEVQKYAQAQDWSGAMRIVDREIARAPHDMDVRAWRARVLAWSGHLAEAEREYRGRNHLFAKPQPGEQKGDRHQEYHGEPKVVGREIAGDEPGKDAK